LAKISYLKTISSQNYKNVSFELTINVSINVTLDNSLMHYRKYVASYASLILIKSAK